MPMTTPSTQDGELRRVDAEVEANEATRSELKNLQSAVQQRSLSTPSRSPSVLSLSELKAGARELLLPTDPFREVILAQPDSLEPGAYCCLVRTLLVLLHSPSSN